MDTAPRMLGGWLTACFMIMSTFGQIAPRTVHDHGLCLECLNLKLDISGYNGRTALVRGAETRLAGMPTTPDEMLSAVSDSLAVRTGRSLEQWVGLVRSSGSAAA
jgi:hypothetical protein